MYSPAPKYEPPVRRPARWKRVARTLPSLLMIIFVSAVMGLALIYAAEAILHHK